MRLIVLVLLIILIGVFCFLFYPVIKAEINLFLLNNNYFKFQIEVVEKKPRKITPIDNQFGIVINKIGATGKIVDTYSNSNISSLQYILRTGLVHLSDSAYPGKDGNMVIISQIPGDWYNTTRSNPEFYLVYKLLPKDIIQVFYNGYEFNYEVTNILKVNEDQVSDFTVNSDSKKSLTILSGWPPGTIWQRLIILAELVEDQSI